MLTFDGVTGTRGALRVLCLGAHSDDIEIGCGGTVLRLLDAVPGAALRWVVFSAPGERGAEARKSAAELLTGATDPELTLHEFRDGFFPWEGARIKEIFESLKEFEPDVVFTHYRDDRHQDHRLLNELAWNTFRDHVVLEYEVPKYDGDLGIPNFFVPVDGTVAERKVDTICRHFQTQHNKHWFTRDNLLALMRLRAVECRAPSGFAEAFHARKVVWHP